MSAKLDRRLTAATDRVALSRLKGVIERPEYTDGTPARIGAPLAELLVRPPVSAGFAILPMRDHIRVTPYYLLDLKRRPLSPLATRLREKLAAISGSARPGAARLFA